MGGFGRTTPIAAPILSPAPVPMVPTLPTPAIQSMSNNLAVATAAAAKTRKKAAAKGAIGTVLGGAPTPSVGGKVVSSLLGAMTPGRTY